MKNIFRHSVTFMLTIIVVILSIGMNISKMKCVDHSQLYFGTKTPSCNIDEEVKCNPKQQLVSCCSNNIEIKCCSETNDNSCSSEIRNLQFDFETLVYNYIYNLNIFNIIWFYASLDIYKDNTKVAHEIYYIKSPPNINYSLLSKIQSFLL